MRIQPKLFYKGFKGLPAVLQTNWQQLQPEVDIQDVTFSITETGSAQGYKTEHKVGVEGSTQGKKGHHPCHCHSNKH